MPLYDFLCPRCGSTEERLQSYTDPPPNCAECGGPMDRRVSRSHFALKGDGWYKDGYGLHDTDGGDGDE